MTATGTGIEAGLPEHPAVRLARTGPATLPLCVRMRPVRYGLRAALPLLLVTSAIFVPFGAWITVSTGSLEPLLSFATIPLALVWLPAAVMFALRSRGPVLAADADGVWLRPELNRTRAAWLPWHGIESVDVRRYFFLRALCVRPRDPGYDARFAVEVAGNRDTKTAMRIVAAWRARALATNIWVPLTHLGLGSDELLARLRDLAGDRCPVRGQDDPAPAAT